VARRGEEPTQSDAAPSGEEPTQSDTAPSGEEPPQSDTAPSGEEPPQSDTAPAPDSVSDELERWLEGDGAGTLGSLVATFGERSFAIVFALLMALPALPLPTGGATHVLEVVTMLLSLELIAGRREIWLPRRWAHIELDTPARRKVIVALLRRIRWLERWSRPRGERLFGYRLSGIAFGFASLGLTLVAFLAPPFSGLDTLPSIGVVALALGFLLTDVVVAAIGLAIGALGIVAVIGLGSLIVHAMAQLL
jgi:hypothetical protein